MNITEGTGQVPRVCVFWFRGVFCWFVLNQTVHVTPGLFTEGHTLLSATDYALLPRTASATSEAVNALDRTGAGSEGAAEGRVRTQLVVALLLSEGMAFKGLKCQV